MRPTDGPKVLPTSLPSLEGRYVGKTASTVMPKANAARLGRQPEAAVSVPRPNTFQNFCFLTLCAYLLSAFANEFAFRLIHTKAYISTFTLALMPAMFVLTGTALRGLRVPFGRWWLAFGCWLAVCAPFSVWRSDTASLLLNYYFRGFLLYFVICACVLRLRELKTLVYVLGFGTLAVVLSCVAFGSAVNGRFAVQGSVFSFLSNSNELGLQLLLGICALLFAVLRGRHLTKLAAAIIIALSTLYMLKTGSRGTFIAVIAVMLAYFWLSRKKIQLLVVLVPLFAISFALLPSEARHRLTYIAIGGDDLAVSSAEDASARDSQLQRQQLFWDSVSLTLRHPILGVGPGEFQVADAHEAEAKGEPAMWRQPHNSYTQVSSEAGLPAFFFYMAALLTCFGLNYRIYKRTIARPELRDYSAVAFCMLLSTVAYAVGTIFDQLAYTTYLPVIAGITMSMYLLIRPELEPAAAKNANASLTSPVPGSKHERTN